MKTKKILGNVEPYSGATEIDVVQKWPDTCGVKSQQIVLEAFGIKISEGELAEEAIMKGYYAPGQGSSPELMGQLLNDHGIPTHTEYGGNVYDLVNELAQGHKVIVGVDADELWRPSFFNDLFGEAANHALIVTGIDTTDPQNVRVLITDPGTGDVAKEYPLEQFLDAWQDANCQFIATDCAPLPKYDNNMINFPFAEGHLPYIGEIPFNVYQNTICPEIDNFMSDYFPANLESDAEIELAANLYEHMHDIVSSWGEELDFHEMLFDNFEL